MIIPFLLTHQYRHCKKTQAGGSVIGCVAFYEFFKLFFHPNNAQANPYGKSITGPCIGVIPFTRLVAGLIQINNNGKAGEEKQQERNKKILPVPIIVKNQTNQS